MTMSSPRLADNGEFVPATETPSVPGRRTCILVLGMHRTGTSALTRLLSLLGAALPKTLMGAGPGNESGHWESERLVAYHDKILAELNSSWDDWQSLDLSLLTVKRREEIRTEIAAILSAEYGDAPLLVVKDPRICRLAPLFLEALAEAGMEARMLLPIRNPLEVAASLEARTGFWSAEHSPTAAGLIWLRHVLDAEQASRGRPRAMLSYGDLLNDWQATIAVAKGRLGLDWPYMPDDIAPQVEQFLDLGKRHHHSSSEDVRLDPALRGWVAEAYEALLVLARNPSAKAAQERLDQIHRDLDGAAPVIARLQQEAHTKHNAIIAAMSAELATLSEQLAAREAEAKHLEAAITKRDEEAVAASNQLADREAEAKHLTQALADRQAEVEQFTAKLADAENAGQILQEAADELRVTLAAHEADAEQLAITIAERDAKAEALSEQQANRDAEVQRLVADLTELGERERSLSAQLTAIQEAQTNLQEASGIHAQATVTNLTSQLTEAQAETRRLADQLAEREAETRRLAAEIRKISEHGNAVMQQAEDRGREVERVAAELAQANELNRAYRNSTSWKLTAPLRGLKLTGIAIGQTPSRIVRVLRVAPAAIRIGGGLMPTMHKTTRVWKQEGLAGVKRRVAYADTLLPLQRRSLFSPPVTRKVPIVSKSPGSRSNALASSSTMIASSSLTFEQSREKPQPLHLSFETKLSILALQQPLEDRINSWRRSLKRQPITSVEVVQRIKDICTKGISDVVISITHDDYRKIVGGVQFCVQLEEQEFSARNILYLNLHPSQPLPVLARETKPDAFAFEAIANGQPIGTVNAHILVEALSNLLPPENSVQCAVHALHGHSPEVISWLLKKLNVNKTLFWIHDYFSACPNHLLLRNDVAHCNAPQIESTSCSVCIYSTERATHLQRMEQLFSSITFDIVSPSQFALELWQKATTLRYRRAEVLPHCTLVAPRKITPELPAEQDHPVRIAFLGHPAMHKGWDVFCHLAQRLDGDRRYEFYHFGLDNTRTAGINFRHVRNSATTPASMQQALTATRIDAVLLWPEWPETFSFTLHEAISTGAFIITNPQSGNIQDTVRNGDLGLIASDEQALLERLTGNEFVDAMRQRRSDGRLVAETKFGRLSGQFLQRTALES